MFETLITPAAAVRWELSGPPGVFLDQLTAQAVGMGFDVECIEPTVRYRIAGDATLLAVFAEEIAKVDGFSLAHEQPPEGVVRVTGSVTPARSYRRTSVVHGTGFGMVARAIDAGLQVSTAGVMRWAITGASATQARWLADAQGLTVDDVLRQWHIDAAQLDAEDASMSITIPVRVELPTRRSTTQTIERNADGDIVRVEAIEVDDK